MNAGSLHMDYLSCTCLTLVLLHMHMHDNCSAATEPATSAAGSHSAMQSCLRPGDIVLFHVTEDPRALLPGTC